MNRRKPRRGLSRDDVDAIGDAFHHARRIDLPLNILVTVHFANTDAMTVPERCEGYDRIKNLIGEYARRHGFQTANVWAREIAPSGHGEHIHIVCHIRRQHCRDFASLALQWLPEPNAIDVRPVSPAMTFARDGKRHSIVLYIAKQMTPQAAFRRPVRRQKGGTIEGQRWGLTRNLRR